MTESEQKQLIVLHVRLTTLQDHFRTQGDLKGAWEVERCLSVVEKLLGTRNRPYDTNQPPDEPT